MVLRTVLAATLLWALALTGCDSGSGADLVPDLAEDISADAPETETGEFLVVTGRVLDEAGDPVNRAMLVMCGEVEGAVVCLQQFAAADGTFIYDDLLEGYTHLQVMPYAAAAESGKLYAGASFLTSLPAPPALYEWGDIVLPIVKETKNLVVADGGLLDLGDISLNIVPGSAAFPDLETEGPVGAVRVGADLIPDALGTGATAFAFFPYDTRLSSPATARIPLNALSDVWDGGMTPISVRVNSTDAGGLYEVPTTVDGSDLVFELSELTWVVVVIG